MESIYVRPYPPPPGGKELRESQRKIKLLATNRIYTRYGYVWLLFYVNCTWKKPEKDLPYHYSRLKREVNGPAKKAKFFSFCCPYIVYKLLER